MFDQTRGSYWGGAHLSFGIFAALAIFPLTGLFGIEQLYLRNPIGMFIKIIGNVLTLGFLYFFDIVQLISDSANIKRAGIQYPLIGPTGIGAGIFKGSEEENIKEAPEDTPQSWKYIVFAILTLLPFGGEHFFVGDTGGGLLKLVSTINPFLWPLAIFLGVVNIYKAFIGVDGLFMNGLQRVWPLTMFMSKQYSLRGKLGPVGEGEVDNSGSGFFSGLLTQILTTFSSIPIIGPYIGKAGDVVQMATAVVNDVVIPTVKAGTELVGVAGSAVTQAPSIASEVTGEINKFATPEGIQQLANEQGVKTANQAANQAVNAAAAQQTVNAVKQIGKGLVGGGVVVGGAGGAGIAALPNNDSTSTVALSFIVVALLLSGITTIYLKMRDRREELKDMPPEPIKNDTKPVSSS
jgi:hypothetical protein